MERYRLKELTEDELGLLLVGINDYFVPKPLHTVTQNILPYYKSDALKQKLHAYVEPQLNESGKAIFQSLFTKLFE